MTRTIAIRQSHYIKIAIAAALLAVTLVFVPAPVHAAGLTTAQVNGVIGLLSAFGVDEATIATVRSILGTGTAQTQTTPATQTSSQTTTNTESTGTQTTRTETSNTPARENSSCEAGLSASQVAEMKSWISLYEQSEAAFNRLWKAIARAGSAPANYVSPNVSPTISQGPNIPDSLDGSFILRKDLYFAHDEAAKARASAECAGTSSCSSYVLPTTHAGAQSALTSYNAAIQALPKFAGPAGMRLIGSPYTYTPRPMSYLDYGKVKVQLLDNQPSCSTSESSRSSSDDDSDEDEDNGSGGDDTPTVSSAKPNMAQFIAAAKTDSSTAASVLYGVIGSNTDVRDWGVIMSSQNPLATARALTSAMYNSGSKAYLAAGATRPQDRANTTVLASYGNFTFFKEIIPGVGVNYILALVDANGYQLTSAANPDVLQKHITNFGFSKADLSALQVQLESKGINLQSITSWPRNFGISSAVSDGAQMMAAAVMVPMDTMVSSINLLADQIIEINMALASVASAYAALFGF